MSSKNYIDEEGDDKKIKFKDNKLLYIKNIFKTIGLFIWNNKQKEFLGREVISWSYVGVMYVVYFSILGAFGWAMIAILMAITQSTNPTRPKYAGLSSPLAYENTFTPGMGMRPHLGKESSHIEFSYKNSDEYTKYVENLDLFLKDYENKISNTGDCDMLTQDQINANTRDFSCTYDVFKYLEQLNCSKNESYGYASGEPCVLIKMNNVFNWSPEKIKIPTLDFLDRPPCNSTNSANGLRNISNHIFYTCNGDSEIDKNNIRSIRINSHIGESDCFGGVPFYFYPYTNEPHYMQPLIVVKLNLTMNQKVQINCNAWASNIKIEPRKGYGFVKFTVKIKS